jgi:pyrimidine operon attenuation protein/uracil phosphoribosyltransferase
MTDVGRQVMDAEDIRRCFMRIAHEIVEKNRGGAQVALVGIRTRGVPMAERIGKHLKNIEGVDVPIGALDVALYRDDISLRNPVVKRTEIPFDVTGKHVVLTDEVLFTGRTIRAAMDAVFDFGRPASIQLAVLVDRGHRELPIRPDFIGKNIPTADDEEVKVSLLETDGKDMVEIIKLTE